eukprot:1022680-Pelagomonas_calceolata.AAC.2
MQARAGRTWGRLKCETGSSSLRACVLLLKNNKFLRTQPISLPQPCQCSIADESRGFLLKPLAASTPSVFAYVCTRAMAPAHMEPWHCSPCASLHTNHLGFCINRISALQRHIASRIFTAQATTIVRVRACVYVCVCACAKRLTWHARGNSWKPLTSKSTLGRLPGGWTAVSAVACLAY